MTAVQLLPSTGLLTVKKTSRAMWGGRLKGAARSKSLRIAGALLLPEHKRKHRSLPEAKDAKGAALEANQRGGLWPQMAGALSEGFRELFHRCVLEQLVREHPCNQGHNLMTVVSQPRNLSPFGTKSLLYS